MRPVRCACGALATWTFTCVGAPAERFPFVLPGNDIEANAVDFSRLHPRPAGADGFVKIRDGRFFVGDRRLRIWGVNVCFGANAPRKEDAPVVAARLSKLGLNGVRFHHHDTQPPPRGVLRPPAAGRRELDPEMMDRQDIFIAELIRHGLYVNLNLHVGRTFGEGEGFENVRDLPYECRYSKYILYFEPRMRRLLKEFIREYLGRFNPHRGLRRAEDPGIAMIEITNENDFSRRGPDLAATLPEPYRGEFRRQFNEWLARRYGSTEALKAAWLADAVPPGPELARLAGNAVALDEWRLNTQRAQPAVVEFGAPGPDGHRRSLRIRVPAAGATHELMRAGLTVLEGRVYSLEFDARADAKRRLYVDVSRQGPGNWGPVGLAERLEIGPQWRRVRRQFRATASLTNAARVCFKFGDSDVPFQLADVVVREGGLPAPLPPGGSVERRSVDIPDAGWPEAAVADARRFMEEVESEFIRDLVRFIKTDVGARMPVTASQITYHGARIVADTCDFADIHAYWQHPRFPGRPWDPRNWRIENTPMEEAAGRDVLFERASWRLLDRPFTISEWNIPAPHDYAASVVPFAALVGALQDWDGVFFFQYASEADRWDRDSLGGYFSFNGHPAKLALLGAFANLYVRGDLEPLRETAAGTCEQRVPPALGFRRRIGIDPKADRPTEVAAPTEPFLATPDGRAVWDARDPRRAHVVVNTPATRAVWGRVAGRAFDLGGLRIEVGEVERDYAVVVVTSLDGAPLETSSRMLLVAVGSAENLGMEWNADRTSVGHRWGQGPTVVNGIPFRLRLNAPVRAVHALDGRGRRATGVAVTDDTEGRSWSVGPTLRTLWYEIESGR